jgi:alpha-L-rhamnosidase
MLKKLFLLLGLGASGIFVFAQTPGASVHTSQTTAGASVHTSQTTAGASVRPASLTCEYLTNPEGIDEPLPRLGWILNATDTNAYGQEQTAYLIEVGSTPNHLGDIWNSGWVTSAQMNQVAYAGKPLQSDKDYYWRVTVKDEKGRVSAPSELGHWSTGLFKRSEWSAQWIGTGQSQDTATKECSVSDPWIRKTIILSKQPTRAMLFVASVGYHEVYVNGQKIGDGVLAPCVSDHTKRARYIAYDISSALKPGINVVGLWLGASWSIFEPYKTADKPRAPIVIAQADIYNDIAGKPVLRIQTDTSWRVHPSPNHLLGQWSFWHMGGESWDMNKAIPDWDQPKILDSSWKPPVAYQPNLVLSAQMVEPNHLYHEIHPLSVIKNSDSTYRVDMGVNFAGWTELHLQGKPGGQIDIQFSEREKEDMTFNLHSVLVLDSTGAGIFRNHFNYSSGRWITFKGLTQAPSLSDMRGWVVRTAYDSAASFVCSDSLQNWIYNRVLWNYENLSLGGYVVDCPQRERMGYGGDAHATSETGVFNYGLGAFYFKWLQDWRDVQGTKFMEASNYGGSADEGILPHTAPTYWGGGGPPWGGIVVTLPWLMYQQQGDRRILEQNFMLIKRWLAYLSSHTKNNLMEPFGGAWDFLGDWLWPHAGAEGMNNTKPQNICFNNCYRVFNLRTAVKIARVLGKTAEAEAWQREADASSSAIQAKYYHPSDHSYADSSMDDLTAALLAEVPPVTLRKAVMDRLAKEILVVHKGHINVGITGGAMLFKLLRAEGRDDLLYAMTSQMDYPGWGYMKANGATSIWEMWEKDLPGHSLLHSSYLYPGAWYIDGVGGIRRDPEHPGFSQFIIRMPSLTQQQMQWASASYMSASGLIRSSWTYTANGLRLHCTVPPGTHAKVYVPAASVDQVYVSFADQRTTYASVIGKVVHRDGPYLIYEVPAGKYIFNVENKPD